MTLQAKKIDSSATYSGINITTDYQSLTVPQFVILWKNAQFCSDVQNALIYISDTVTENLGENAFVMIEDFIDQIDNSGRKISRQASTQDGWYYQLLTFEATTSKINGYRSSNYDNTNLNFIEYKLYDSSNVEITDPASENTAVKTVIYLRPNYDYEIIGSVYGQYQAPATDVTLHVIGAPDLPGGNIAFIPGGINLKHVSSGTTKLADGRTSKLLMYNPTYVNANAFKFIIYHNTGIQHNFQISFETYKGP